MSHWFATKPDLNQSAQLQRVARILKLCMELVQLMYFRLVKNEGAAQTAWMRRLVCAFVVRMQQSQLSSTLSRYTF